MLDTSVVIQMLQGNEAVLARAAALPRPALLSAITRAELENGAAFHRGDGGGADALAARHALDEVLAVMPVVPFDDGAAARFGRLIAELGYNRRKFVDRMIAATALVARAQLATLNARDFTDVPGLEVENWREP